MLGLREAVVSETPRTDAVYDSLHGCGLVKVDFARQLERENARLREAWIHAYTSLGCDRTNAEKMVQAEIDAYAALAKGEA